MNRNTENDPIQQLFDNFDPGLPAGFMERLERRIELLESIRQENRRLRRHSRIAMAVASIVGFITGILFTLALPYIGHGLQTLAAMLPTLPFVKDAAVNFTIPALLLMALSTAVICRNSYEFTLALLKWRQ